MTPRHTTITPAAFGLLRAHLAARFGMTPSQLNASVGANHGLQTRAQVAANLAAWARDRPKAA